MPFDVHILATDDYLPEEIVIEDIPEKYLYDEQGNFCLASTVFNSEKAVPQLINFLFQSPQAVTEVYRNMYAYILDLSLHKEKLIDFNYLEQYYPKWLENTGRENTMNEYGMLTDFIGFSKKGSNRKYLLMIISNERHSS